MTLASKPTQMLLAVLIAVMLGPPLGAVVVFLAGFGMYAGAGYSWSLSPEGLASGGRMLLALVAVAYIFATPIALAGGIFVAGWILWRPPTLGAAVAAALIASLGYTMLRTDGYMQRDSLVTVGASVAAATGCWFLTRRFARTA
jgi:hypothetical protein